MRLPTLCLLLIFSSQALAEDWTFFRGPSGAGVSQAANVPSEFSPDSNVAWKKQIAGLAWSSPVVRNDRIYLTTAVPVGAENILSEKKSKNKKQVDNPYSLRTMCLDLSTGEVLWDVEVSQVPPRVSIHPKNSHASGTPIVTDDRVYVHFGAYGTAALDLDGEIIWKNQIEFSPVHGSGGSPVLFEDQLIFHCDGGTDAFVISLDAETGKQRWRTPRDKAERSFSFATPLIVDTGTRKVLVSPASHAVYGYDPATGQQLWKVDYPNKWSIVPQPVFAGDLLLVCTGYEGPAELLAIKPGGEGNVTESHVIWRTDKFIPYNPTPAVDGDKIFMVSDAGIASCRDLTTGELYWKKRLGDNYSASPIIAEGRVYFLSEDGKVTVIEAAPEYRQIAENDMESRSFATPVPIEGGLLIRTEDSLYRLGR